MQFPHQINRSRTIRLAFTLVTLCLIPLHAFGEIRTWTDAATNRTLEGEFVKTDGKKVTISLANGRSIDIPINRLADADKEFIKTQAASENKVAGSPLAVIKLPVSYKTLSIKGKGENREASIQLTNNSGKSISMIKSEFFLHDMDGNFKKEVGNKKDGDFDKNGKILKDGQSVVVKLTDFFIKDDIASVTGLVKELMWEDGSSWPAWVGPATKPEDDAPVSLAMKGVVRNGDIAIPLIECFNHSKKGVTTLMYRLYYLDAEGKELNKPRRSGRSFSKDNPVEPEKGIAFLNGDKPPKGAVHVRLSLYSAKFDDGSSWKAKK